MKVILMMLLLTATVSANAWTGVDINSGKAIYINGSDQLNYGDRVSFRVGDNGSYQKGVILSKFNFGNDFQLEVREEQFGDVSVINIEN